MRCSGNTCWCGGQEGTVSAERMADTHEAKVQLGAKAGLAEFEKMYGVWLEVPTMLFHLRSQRHRQVVAHFVAESLGATAETEVRDEELVNWFEEKVVREGELNAATKQRRTYDLLKQEMRDLCAGFQIAVGSDKWEGLREDLLVLAKAPSKKTLQHLGLHTLHRFLHFNVDVVPVMNLIVELSFSCLKTTEQTNAGSSTTDLAMAMKMQIFHPARVQRVEFKQDNGKDCKAPSHLDNGKQYIHWVHHCARTSQQHTRTKMIDMPPLERFRQQKTSNLHSKNNATFVQQGKDLRMARVRRKKTFDLAAAAAKIVGRAVADDIHHVQMEGLSEDTAIVRDNLLVSGHWDRTFTTATEKDAAARHLPFKWLVFNRAVFKTDGGLKKAVRKWIGVVKLVLRFVGRTSPVKSDSGDPIKMKEYYHGATDRLNFLESGIYMRAKQRQWTKEEPPLFRWLLPPGIPPPCCSKAGYYKQLGPPPSAKPPRRSKHKRLTPRKRRRRSSSSSEETSDSDSEDDAHDSDASERGDGEEDDGGDGPSDGLQLQRSDTLDQECQMDCMLDGPNDEGKFLIRWEGWGEDGDTWEPPRHLPPGVVDAYLKDKAGE